MWGQSKTMPSEPVGALEWIVFGKSVRVRVAAALCIVVLPAIVVVMAWAWYQDRAAQTLRQQAAERQGQAIAREIIASFRTTWDLAAPLAAYLGQLPGDDQRCASLRQIGALPRSTGRAALLIHGVASSCGGSLGGLPGSIVLTRLQTQLRQGSRFAVAGDPAHPDRGLMALALEGDDAEFLLLSLAKAEIWDGNRVRPRDAPAVTILDTEGHGLLDLCIVKTAGAGDGPGAAPGEAAWLVTSPIPMTSLVVAVQYPGAALPAFGGGASWITAAALIAVMMLTIFAAVVAIDRTIGRWIDYLSRIAVAHSRGRLSVRASRLQEAPREIADLGNAINRMAENIAGHAAMLEAAVVEKGRTLQELHHRVKNNFQIVSSLLTLQRKALAPERAKDFRFIEDHVHAMAAAYRTAYSSAEVTHVFATEIAKDIIAILCETAGFVPSTVDIRVVEDDRRVDLDRAITIGLTLAYLLPPRLDVLRATGKPVRVDIRFVDALLTIQVLEVGMIVDTDDDLRQRLAKAYMRRLQVVAGPIGDDIDSLQLQIPVEELPAEQH